MPGFGGEVHGAAKHVEDTTIHVVAGLAAQGIVQALGTAATEIGHRAHADGIEVARDGWAHARNAH